jgi:hypothetical protein
LSCFFSRVLQELSFRFFLTLQLCETRGVIFPEGSIVTLEDDHTINLSYFDHMPKEQFDDDGVMRQRGDFHFFQCFFVVVVYLFIFFCRVKCSVICF